MKTRTLILATVLLPLIGFATTPGTTTFPENKNLENEMYILEDWMTDLSGWNAEPSGKPMQQTGQVSKPANQGEEVLKLEPWMYQPETRNWSDETREPELKMEEWMLEPAGWLNYG